VPNVGWRKRGSLLAPPPPSSQFANWWAVVARTHWPRQRECGVYVITNVVNGKSYVGHSTDITARWRRHLKNLAVGHVNPRLKNAWLKHGGGVFRFSLVERVPPERDALIVAEQRWIDKLRAARDGGYNGRPLADTPLGRKAGKEERAALSARMLGKKFPNRPRQSEETKAKRRAWWLSPEGLTEKGRLAARSSAKRGGKWTEAQRAAWLRLTPERKAEIAKSIGAAHRKPWSAIRRAAETARQLGRQRAKGQSSLFDQ